MVYPVRSVWFGASLVSESATVATSAARWDALRASWEGGLRDQVGEPSVAWDREAVLVLAGSEMNDHVVSLAVSRLARTGDKVSVEVSYQGQPVDIWTPTHPTLVAVVPQAAFAGAPAFQLTWNGTPWPVACRVER